MNQPEIESDAGVYRTTVLLNPVDLQNLEQITSMTGCNKTEAIRRGLKMGAYLEKLILEGGAVYIRESKNGELERLRFV